MTEEIPYEPKSDYQEQKISEENGLVENFEDRDPEYLLEDRGETMETRQIDLGEFLYQRSLGDFLN